MDRPTEFVPIYDQTQKQAADMVEKMFAEIEGLKAERNELRAELDSARKAYGKLFTENCYHLGECDDLRAQLEAHGKIFDQLGLDVDEWRGNGIDSGELAECIDFAIMRHNAILQTDSGKDGD